MPLSVDVVIPVHGQWELTERCLATLVAHDASVRRVIVVDDKSPDDTAARLRGRHDVVPVILEQNVGFARACNAGARIADADAIFFLNNDTQVPPFTIGRLAEALEESGAAAVGPKILNADGTLQVAGLAMLAGSTHFERLYVYLDADLPQAQIPYDPVALSGAAVLVRRAAFEAVGGFEEAFLNGSEDVDLSLKLWAAGFRCRYAPRATIVHLEGASRGKMIDGAPNDRLLEARWKHRTAALPRYREPLPPLLDLRWRSATLLETAVKRSFRATLAEHAGARVVENAPVLARIAAVLDRRARLSIEHRGRDAVSDVVWCAPESAEDAIAFWERGARRYWVPSERSAEFLCAAGVAPATVSITRPGFAPTVNAVARPLTAAVLVHRKNAATSEVAPLRTALTGLPVEVVVAEGADEGALLRIASAPLVVFADPGDAWGFLGGTALAGGALVVAPAGSPFLETIPPHACVVTDGAAAATEAVRAIRADPASFSELGPRAAREMSRVASDVQAGRRIRELGRALVHGVVDPLTLAMTEATVATLNAPGG